MLSAFSLFSAIFYCIDINIDRIYFLL